MPLKIRKLGLMEKWWWRIYYERDKLWNKVLVQRYGQSIHYDLNESLSFSGASHIMKNVVSLKDFISEVLNRGCFRWIHCNGEKIYFWEDWWREEGPLKETLPRLYSLSKLKHVSLSSFLNKWQSRAGNESLWSSGLEIRDEPSLRTLTNILLEIRLMEGEDGLLWTPGDGEFSSKKCCKVLMNSNEETYSPFSIWNRIWKAKVPPKIAIFLWKLQREIVPTRKFLSERIATVPTTCLWCNEAVESINHLFWKCTLASEAWNFIGHWWGLEDNLRNIHSFSLENLLNCEKREMYSKFWIIIVAVTTWTIWLCRNELLFNNNRTRTETIELLIFTRVNIWGSAAKIMDFGNDPLWRVNPH